MVRKSLLSNKSLAKIGFEKGLNSCLVHDPITNPSAFVGLWNMATTIEALVGGVYVDRGEEAMGRFVDSLGFRHIFLQPEQRDEATVAMYEEVWEGFNDDDDEVWKGFDDDEAVRNEPTTDTPVTWTQWLWSKSPQRLRQLL